MPSGASRIVAPPPIAPDQTAKIPSQPTNPLITKNNNDGPNKHPSAV